MKLFSFLKVLLRLMMILVFLTIMIFSIVRPLCAGPLEDLAVRAEKEDPVVWYESSTQDETDKVIAAFNKRYPKVKVQHIRITGGNVMSGRIIQETQAGGKTADMATSGVSDTWQLGGRQMLENLDWKFLGISERLVASPFATVSAAASYVLIYNTQLVKEADAPKDWEDLLDPKWKNRLGTWYRAGGFAQLAKVWGEERTTRYMKKFVEQNPFLFRSTYPLAQQVGAGEVHVALGMYHTAQPPLKKGAPIKVAALDPVPVSSVYTFLMKTAKNPNGAKLFIAWLHSSEGAKAYEEATGRGNHLLPGTRSAAFFEKRRISEFSPSENDVYTALIEKYTSMLAQGGKMMDK